MPPETISRDCKWMEKLESWLDCIDARLECMQADLKCTRVAIQELLSIVKQNAIENRVSSSGLPRGA